MEKGFSINRQVLVANPLTWPGIREKRVLYQQLCLGREPSRMTRRPWRDGSLSTVMSWQRILSHGQASVEKGLSINRQVLVANPLTWPGICGKRKKGSLSTVMSWQRILSHGQASVEKGFSINRQVLVANPLTWPGIRGKRVIYQPLCLGRESSRTARHPWREGSLSIVSSW